MAGFERYAESEMDPILRSVCYQWTQKIRLAANHKREVFGNAAEECTSSTTVPGIGTNLCAEECKVANTLMVEDMMAVIRRRISTFQLIKLLSSLLFSGQPFTMKIQYAPSSHGCPPSSPGTSSRARNSGKVSCSKSSYVSAWTGSDPRC